MSIILDALRRADADRERARGLPPALDGLTRSPHGWSPAAGPRSRWLPALAVGALLALAAAGAWWLGRSTAPATVPPAVPSATPVGAPPGAAPGLSDASPAPAVARETPTASAPLRVEASAALASPSRPTALVRAPRVAAVRASAPAATETAAAVPLLEALAPGQRAGLPPLKVGGSMYSPEPRSRVLVLDGRALTEGETLQPGLVLEHIGPKSAQLRWRDQRFELRY